MKCNRLSLALAAMLAAQTFVSAITFADDVAAKPVETASLVPSHTVDINDASALPAILSQADRARYAKIMHLQKDGQWPQADKLIKVLDDDVLMGHVLYQRYMHPTKYRSKYVELKDWMTHYADHPDATRIYKLALKRRPNNYKYPAKPRGVDLSELDLEPTKKVSKSAKTPKPEREYRSKSKRKKIRKIQYQVKHLVQRGNVTISLEKLHQKSVRKLFDNISYAESLGIVARGYFRYHKDEEAIAVANEAVGLSPKVATDAMWWGGLSAWRLKRYELAGHYFGTLAKGKYVQDSTKAAAAYWASRSFMVGGEPAKVNPMLVQAASYQRSFYGLLANRALGDGHGFDWELPALSVMDIELITRVPAARRAMALIEAGLTDLAEVELRRFIGTLPDNLSNAMLAFADREGLANVAYRIGASLERYQGKRVDAALYPLPGWEPREGYNLDKALVFAFVRQESRYQPKAKSSVGARGLMQLMPATAGYIAGKRFKGKARDELFDPAYNLSLGQKYITHLLESPMNGGNLFYLTAAYNGGPGNLQKWMKKVNYQDDPLLFIETIPSRETRLFIEHVLSNLWIYRYRLDQETPSLDAILAGNWPIYIGLDSGDVTVAYNTAIGVEELSN